MASEKVETVITGNYVEMEREDNEIVMEWWLGL